MTLLGHRDAYNHTMHAHIILSHSRCIIHYVSHVRNPNCPSLQKKLMDVKDMAVTYLELKNNPYC